MKQNKLYNTAIYCRLSLDDGIRVIHQVLELKK